MQYIRICISVCIDIPPILFSVDSESVEGGVECVCFFSLSRYVILDFSPDKKKNVSETVITFTLRHLQEIKTQHIETRFQWTATPKQTLKDLQKQMY